MNVSPASSRQSLAYQLSLLCLPTVSVQYLAPALLTLHHRLLYLKAPAPPYAYSPKHSAAFFSVTALHQYSLYASPCPAAPCPALALPCPALSCPILPCPVLPYLALPCPALPYLALPRPALPYFGLSCPTCPILPHVALLCSPLPCLGQ